MFIRRSKTRTTGNGSCYYSQRLVENYRVADRVRQHTLLNPGTQFNFPREQWQELTHRVEGHIFITLLAYNLALQIRCR